MLFILLGVLIFKAGSGWLIVMVTHISCFSQGFPLMLVSLSARNHTTWGLQCWLLVQLLLNEHALLVLKAFDLFLCCVHDRILIAIVLLFVELWIVKLLSLDHLLDGTWYIGLGQLSSTCLEFWRVLIADLLLRRQIIRVVVEEVSRNVVIIIILRLSLMNSFSWIGFLLGLRVVEWTGISFHL